MISCVLTHDRPVRVGEVDDGERRQLRGPAALAASLVVEVARAGVGGADHDRAVAGEQELEWALAGQQDRTARLRGAAGHVHDDQAVVAGGDEQAAVGLGQVGLVDAGLLGVGARGGVADRVGGIGARGGSLALRRWGGRGTGALICVEATRGGRVLGGAGGVASGGRPGRPGRGAALGLSRNRAGAGRGPGDGHGVRGAQRGHRRDRAVLLDAAQRHVVAAAGVLVVVPARVQPPVHRQPAHVPGEGVAVVERGELAGHRGGTPQRAHQRQGERRRPHDPGADHHGRPGPPPPLARRVDRVLDAHVLLQAPRAHQRFSVQGRGDGGKRSPRTATSRDFSPNRCRTGNRSGFRCVQAPASAQICLWWRGLRAALLAEERAR